MDAEFRAAAMEFASLWPVFKVQTLHKANTQPWKKRLLGRIRGLPLRRKRCFPRGFQAPVGKTSPEIVSTGFFTPRSRRKPRGIPRNREEEPVSSPTNSAGDPKKEEGETRDSYRDKCFGTIPNFGPGDYAPPCYRRHQADNTDYLDWPHTMSAIYRVRNNLLHGAKTFHFRYAEDLFVKLAFYILWRMWGASAA
jgi:hypothetical protein